MSAGDNAYMEESSAGVSFALHLDPDMERMGRVVISWQLRGSNAAKKPSVMLCFFVSLNAWDRRHY